MYHFSVDLLNNPVLHAIVAEIDFIRQNGRKHNDFSSSITENLYEKKKHPRQSVT